MLSCIVRNSTKHKPLKMCAMRKNPGYKEDPNEAAPTRRLYDSDSRTSEEEAALTESRDATVPADVWAALNQAKAEAKQRALEQRAEKMRAEQERKQREAEVMEAYRVEQERIRRIRANKRRQTAEKRAKRLHDAMLAELVRRWESEEAVRREEARKAQAIQEKLRTLRRCPAGFTWFHTGGGWRCRGELAQCSYDRRSDRGGSASGASAHSPRANGGQALARVAMEAHPSPAAGCAAVDGSASAPCSGSSAFVADHAPPAERGTTARDSWHGDQHPRVSSPFECEPAAFESGAERSQGRDRLLGLARLYDRAGDPAAAGSRSVWEVAVTAPVPLLPPPGAPAGTHPAHCFAPPSALLVCVLPAFTATPSMDAGQAAGGGGEDRSGFQSAAAPAHRGGRMPAECAASGEAAAAPDGASAAGRSEPSAQAAPPGASGGYSGQRSAAWGHGSSGASRGDRAERVVGPDARSLHACLPPQACRGEPSAQPAPPGASDTAREHGSSSASRGDRAEHVVGPDARSLHACLPPQACRGEPSAQPAPPAANSESSTRGAAQPDCTRRRSAAREHRSASAPRGQAANGCRTGSAGVAARAAAAPSECRTAAGECGGSSSSGGGAALETRLARAGAKPRGGSRELSEATLPRPGQGGHVRPAAAGKGEGESPLVAGVARMVEAWVAADAPAAGARRAPSIFEGNVPAGIGVPAYVARLARRGLCPDDAVLVAVLVYMARVRASGVALSAYNVHRYLLACFVLALKATSDRFYSNAFYASVGGVRLLDLNLLESSLLSLLDWSLFVSRAEAKRSTRAATSAAADDAIAWFS
ncbi:Nuc-1 negative regulatory protein preg [Diplonema papillatum]|nr:Nuc-1 negative regulatory protein preg [Diplonema papillatum]